MAHYRIKMLNSAGMTVGSQDHPCESDELALNQALLLLPHCDVVEVWLGVRLIRRIPNSTEKDTQK